MPRILTCPSCAAPLQYDGRTPSIKCEYCNNITLIPAEYRQTKTQGQRGSFGSSAPFEDFSQTLPLDQLIEINDLLSRGRKIQAIKLFRETFKVGLKEAKEAVERLERGEAINLSGQQKIMAFHDTIDMDQMEINMDRSEMVINVESTPNVPQQVVLGGQSGVRQKPGCITGFIGRFGCLLFVFFWLPFLIVMVGPLIYPDMVLLAAPLACEEGYQETYSERVGYYSTGNFEGTNIVLLHCVYEAGADDIPHPFMVNLILFAGPMAVMAVLAFGIAFLGGVRTLSEV